MKDLIERLKAEVRWLSKAAAEIREDCHAGWGNTCEQAADTIDEALAALPKEGEVVVPKWVPKLALRGIRAEIDDYQYLGTAGALEMIPALVEKRDQIEAILTERNKS